MTVFSRRTARRAAPEGPAASRRRSKLGRVTARAVVPVAAVGGLAGLSLAAPAVTAAAPAAAHLSSARVVPAIGHPVFTKALTAPISTTQCQAQLGIACYSPLQYRVAYNLNPLYKGGITGAGRTIVIVDSFGSPTIANDLHVFDQQWGFPDPDLQVMKFGNVPPFDPTDSTMVGWAEETTLDVEYAHSIAPGAKIVLAETPVAEVEGTSGLPEMMNAEKSLIDRGIGDVITQSFGATENTFPGFDSGNFSSLLNLRYAFKDALAHGVTVLASSGDDGATDAESDASTLYPFRVNSWPSSDPLVTSVGGTMLNLDNSGNRLSPDVVWNDGFGAGGGGVSGVFPRPGYQSLVTKEVGKKRGTPDISMSAAVNGAAWVYYVLRRRQRRLAPLRRHQRGVADLLRHRRARRPGGPPPARPAQPRALSHGRAEPARRRHRDRGRHLRQQLLRRRHRLRRRDRLRPGQRLGHDRRGEVRPRARAHRLTRGSS